MTCAPETVQSFGCDFAVWDLIRAGEVHGVNKGGHRQSGATAHVRDRSNLHGTLAGDAERYVKSSGTSPAMYRLYL